VIGGPAFGEAFRNKDQTTEAILETVMTADLSASVKASRVRVPRTRGAMSGLLLLLLGAWAALVPFIGPYFNVAFTPAPNTAWHWTAARGWLEVLPGAAAFLGGLLLLVSASRLTTSLGGWLGVASGAWLIVGPPLAGVLNLNLGTPDPASSEGVQALEALLFFYGIGAAILFVSAVAIGRLSVHSVRDVRAAERRAEAELAAEAEQRRLVEEQVARENERRAAAERNAPVAPNTPGAGTSGYPDGQPVGVGRHENLPQDENPGAGSNYASNYSAGGAHTAPPTAQYPPATDAPPPPRAP
jgi:hypothetical protein